MSILDRIWENTEFYQLIRGYPGGIVIFGLRGEILEVNDTFVNLLGCSESTLYEKKYFDICAADYNAKEAEILKKQAFVTGYTELYPKKYEFEGTSVLVNQHTYLVKDAVGKPMVMLAMLCPVLPDSESGTLNQDMRQLAAENARLKASSAIAEAGTLQQNIAMLEKQLAEAKETIAVQERTIIVKDKALTLKDKAIEKMTATEVDLNNKLIEAQGALEVAMIVEDGKAAPEAPFLPAGPMPEIDDDEEHSPDTPDTEAATNAADNQDENKSADDAPWEADTETETKTEDSERSEATKADPFADAPWEADDVVYDDDVVPPSDQALEEKPVTDGKERSS